MSENFYFFSAIVLFFSNLFTFIWAIYLLVKLRKERVEAKMKDRLNNRKSLEEITKSLNKSIDIIIENYHPNDIVNEMVISKTSLDTDTYLKIDKKILSDLLRLTPDHEILSYNELLKGEFIAFTTRLIHNKVQLMDINVKRNLKEKANKQYLMDLNNGTTTTTK